MDFVKAYIEKLRQRADEREREGASSAARQYQLVAAELEAEHTAHLSEALTLARAAEESGYSVVHLQRLVTEGTLPNLGRKGAPRIRRGDLPRRPGHNVGPTLHVAGAAREHGSRERPSLAEIALRGRRTG